MSQLKLCKPITQCPTQCYFSIEGNIGCGKSTFLQLIKENIPEVKWIEQPVSQWQNLGVNNINILQRYYKQPQRWGFTFQSYAILTRINSLNQVYQRFPQKIIITQRSLLADKHVFSQLMRDLNYMNELQYEIFKSMYTSIEQIAKIKNLKVIYLQCSPEKCFERTKIRKRQQQQQIPLEYLKLIHQKHQKWLGQPDSTQILIINTTQDFKNDAVKINQMLQKVRKFISYK